MTRARKNSDNMADTRPSRPVEGMDLFQSVRISGQDKRPFDNGHAGGRIYRKRSLTASIMFVFLFVCLTFVVGLAYFAIPFRTNFVVLGLDAGLGRGDLGRTDTIILCTFSPLMPYVGMLSIPRDLWLRIENVGENRINTAYFFAEAEEAGSGADAVLQVIKQNFNVPVSYYVVVRMDGLINFIDALGGVDISLSKAIAGYEAGKYHLNGSDALKFARNRTGSDDFSRMMQGQILIQGVIRRLFMLETWINFPEIIRTANEVIDMKIPIWHWPRVLVSFLRVGQEHIDSRTISREMVQPFVTSAGAQVLLPNWELINPVVNDMFGRFVK